MKKGVLCHIDSLNRSASTFDHVSVLPPKEDDSSKPAEVATPSQTAAAAVAGGVTDRDDAQDVSLISAWEPMAPTLDGFLSTQMPSFYDQIMAPGSAFVAADTTQLPPVINNVFPDQDWLTELDMQIFATDFVPTVDQALNPHPWPSPTEQSPVEDGRIPMAAAGNAGLTRNEQARKRHAVFKKSPWLWFPESKQHAFSEHNDIRLDEANLHSAASPLEPYAETFSIPDKVSMRSRDEIFQLILRTAKSQISIPSFPAADCLELLMKIGIAKRLVEVH